MFHSALVSTLREYCTLGWWRGWMDELLSGICFLETPAEWSSIKIHKSRSLQRKEDERPRPYFWTNMPSKVRHQKRLKTISNQLSLKTCTLHMEVGELFFHSLTLRQLDVVEFFSRMNLHSQNFLTCFLPCVELKRLLWWIDRWRGRKKDTDSF